MKTKMKQKYYKKENKKVNKDNLVEITGNRHQLKDFVGEVLEVQCYVTNSYGFQYSKRLVTEVRIPNTNLYIKHLWMKRENVAKLQHGYQNLKVKIVEYNNHKFDEDENNYTKYGIVYEGEEGKIYVDKKMYKKHWDNCDKQHLSPLEKKMAAYENAHKKTKTKTAIKQPFRKMTKIKKR